MAESSRQNMKHLGDGTYVEVQADGGIWFMANHHTNRVLYLEPGALEKLNDFVKSLKQ